MIDEFHVAFGQVIRARRLALGMSQEQLAYRLDSAAGTISRFESGHKTPTLRYAERLGSALGYPLEFLLIDARAFLDDQRAERGAA